MGKWRWEQDVNEAVEQFLFSQAQLRELSCKDSAKQKGLTRWEENYVWCQPFLQFWVHAGCGRPIWDKVHGRFFLLFWPGAEP